MTDPARDKFSESTLKLSERYGIDPARLDAILGKPRTDAPAASAVEPTREWIEERRIHQPNVDPVPRPKDPVKIVDPTIATAAASTPARKVKDVRLEGSSLAGGARNEKTNTYQKEGTSPLTWIIGLVILGMLALMFFFTRGCNDKPAAQAPTSIIDTVVKTDTLATTDTVAISADSAATAAATKPAAPSSRPRARRASTASSRNVALSTTSSFAAQERLAELKADGNKNAKIQRVSRNGVTLYQVKTR